MKKRIFLLFLMVIALALPSHAVLKEGNLDTTLFVLRNELSNYHIDLEKRSKNIKQYNQQMVKELIEVINQADQNTMMLYSQKSGYVFELTYACHQATEAYRKFKKKTIPFQKILRKNKIEVGRLDSLIENLRTMQVDYMSEKTKTDRACCLALAINIRRTLAENGQQLMDYQHYYELTEKRLKYLNDYAVRRYADIQNSIFSNADGNYLQTLASFGKQWRQTSEDVTAKYKPIGSVGHMVSQWDVRIIFMLFAIIIFYALVSIILNIVVIRVILTRILRSERFSHIKEEFMIRRRCIIMAMTVITFAIILGIIRATVQQNFIIMACGLLVQYTWLLGMILLSLLLRVKAEQIMSAFRIYSPLLVIGFIVIVFRIVLIPNTLINLIFPPILLLCSLWQWSVICRQKKNVPKTDMYYTWVSLIVIIGSTLSGWMGWTFFSVIIVIWWVMQLTCILTITFFRGWLMAFASRHKLEEKDIRHKWFFNLLLHLLLPIAALGTIVLSIYWAAEVFNLSDAVWGILDHKYVNFKQISFNLWNLLTVVVLFYIFRYINHTADAFMKLHFEMIDPTTSDSRYTMTKNVLQVLTWGTWLLISVAICNVSYTWFVVISGGLSTGIGFAMKDILENIYYGISLMAGRIKIGDYIVCDGVRGRVSSITYTSTMLEALDGSVMAFQNSQLFTKNYRNMTKNHGYELDILEVGVAYGTNIDEVKKIIIEGVSKLKCINHEKGVKVLLKSFDDSCITLRILVWVNVLNQAIADAEVMECIYNVFNKNGIEIPFPQREITIKQISPDVSKITKDSFND